MNFVAVTQSLASLALLSGVAGLALLLALAVPASRRALAARIEGEERGLVGLAAAVALVASAGSLYYSEVVGFVPCVLCWYQRIAMYPIVLVLGVGAIRKDPNAWAYGLPLSVVGLAIALYHVTIQFRPALDVGACGTGVPCTGRYLAIFGFVSIPVMAAGGFLLISGLLLTAWAGHRRGGDDDGPAAGLPAPDGVS
jgi:disulfide bond formation protein DsbB